MRAVSSDFAPPLKLISPFFWYGVLFYLLSMGALLFFSPDFVYAQMDVAGWVHLFLRGFVMMIIFGAMTQLVPVALEAGHAVVDVYYIIFPLLGFVAAMITGHLYKIVPFLVWFERFAPLVGKEKVPMLHEMYPKEAASFFF